VEVADEAEDRPDLLNMLADDPDLAVLLRVAQAAALSTELARRIYSGQPDVAVRDALAGNPAVPADILAELLTSGGDPPVRTCGACRTAPEAAARCPDHATGVRRIRQSALSNPATPAARIAGFVDDDLGSWVLRALVARTDLPVETCQRLARSEDPDVRGRLAENPALPAYLIDVLAEDADLGVRARLARNPAIPLPLLERLAAYARLGRQVAPRIAAAGEDELIRLAGSSTAQVRALVAAREKLPPDLLAAFVDDPDHGVARRIAVNPALTGEQLWALARRHGVRVFATVATNPHCPPELLAHIAEHGRHSGKALREVARHPSATVPALLCCLAHPAGRRYAAERPDLPADIVAALLHDPDQRIRLSAAANPALPVEAMVRLLLRGWFPKTRSRPDP